MDKHTLDKLMNRKDELWSFMWKIKELPKVLEGMEIIGTREQMRQMEKMLTVIKEMD